ncbi:cupin domain-containing protein [Cognatishimia sp. F0-27]|uniref:cupin domain-containing protein n=1 Tax=Cognatishimia sp. F0-27 TaxID=2816855 RepID=UPI001D0C9377|nr:cupin domain-containing protein [Cognatishimia sp. F0-27]MCC1493602.1 cupin domain-containing protein [Cognatishimia sp. F0-27]
MTEKPYLLRAEEIAAMAGLEKTHFLNPDAKRVNKSLGDATGLTGVGVHLIEVAPGAETTEYHVHHHEDECVYILEGTATAQIGDDRLAVGAGDFIGYRKGGLAHTIVNTGDQTLRCLVIGQRLDHDIGDYPNKGKRIFRNVGLPWTLVDHDALTSVTAGAKTKD